jgi:integrase/recombinase XerD
LKKATAIVAIDRNHPRKDNTCSIYVRVTFQRRKREYPTGISMIPAYFDRIMIAQRRKGDEQKVYGKILSFHSKALSVIEGLPIFTFDLFESHYLNNTEASDTIKSGFERHIAELYQQNRIGTAVSYTTALNSIERFKSGLRYADITPEFLRKYEAHMIGAGRSMTTIGIYMRSLRTIMNRADVDKKLYPFGQGKNKYSIPEGRNIKKALTLSEIRQIFDFKTEAHTTKAMAKDYWVFIYLCNGLNVKDLCLLKYKDVEGSILKYMRAKTSRSKRNSELITVSLKAEAKAIIDRWGQAPVSPETYIFPHIDNQMTLHKQRRVYQQLTKTINKHMKQIASELAINKDITTYFARHSFATILRDSGASVEFISEALGHSDTKTTKNYLASFQPDTIHQITDALTAF